MLKTRLPPSSFTGGEGHVHGDREVPETELPDGDPRPLVAREVVIENTENDRVMLCFY